MKKLLLIALLAFICPLIGLSQATSGFHRVNQVIARGTSGVGAQVVPYASIAVTNTATGFGAVIYSDPGLSAVISPAVVKADASGNYGYYIPTGYCVSETVSSPGQGSYVIPNVCINGGSSSLIGYPINVAAPPLNAVADNVTDNTAAIQAAINSASFTGANVFVPSAPAGYCYKFTKLYFYYDAVLNPGYNQSGGYSFNFGGNRTSRDNDGQNAGTTTATTCLTSTSSTGPAMNMGGGPGFAGRTGTSTITQTSMSSGTATFSWTLVSGAAPVNGQIVQIGGTTNGSGQFNLQGATIATVSGTTSGTFTVTGLLPASTYGSQAETGTANYGGINYLFEQGNLHDFTLTVNNATWGIDADYITGWSGLNNITVYQNGTGGGIRMEDIWEHVSIQNVEVYSEYGKAYASSHGGALPTGTVGIKMCNNINAGLVSIDKTFVGYWDHGFELGSVNAVNNCGAYSLSSKYDNMDASSDNVGVWIGSGPQGSLDHLYTEGDLTAGVELGSYSQGNWKITNGSFTNTAATVTASIWINQLTPPGGYTRGYLSGVDIENNFIFFANTYGILLSDPSGFSTGTMSRNLVVGNTNPTAYGIGLPATTAYWFMDNNSFQMASTPYNYQNYASATLSYDGNTLLAQNFGVPGGLYLGGSPSSTNSSELTSSCAGKCVFQFPNTGTGTFTPMINGLPGSLSNYNSTYYTITGGTLYLGTFSGPNFLASDGTSMYIGNNGGTFYFQSGATDVASIDGTGNLDFNNSSSNSHGGVLGATNTFTGKTNFYLPYNLGTTGVYLPWSTHTGGFSFGANVAGVQGTDTSLLSSGTISGTGAVLCTDANGGATTTGCGGGSNISGGVLGSAVYQSAPGTTAVTAANTTAGTLCLTETGTGSVGAAPVWGACSGSSATAWSAVTGATNTGQAFLVGNGSTFGATGTGTIAATSAANLAGGAAGNISYQTGAGASAFDNSNLFYSTTAGPSSTPAFAVGPRGSNTLLGVFDAFQSVAAATAGAFYNTGAQSSTGGAFIDAYSDPGAAMTSGSQLGCFRFGGNDLASPTVTVGASMCGYAAANWSNTSYPTTLKVYTVPTGSTTLTLALTIDNTQTTTFANLPILPGTGWVYANNTTVATVTTTPSFATGTTAVTQTTADSSVDVATDAFVHNVVGTQIADATFTVNNATVVGANACVGPSTVTMTGVATTSTFTITASTDTHAITGWGAPAAGVLYITDYPTSNTLNYYVCNNGSASITTSGSVTFNVSAHL